MYIDLSAVSFVFGTILAEGTVAIYQTIKIRKELEIKKYINESLIFIIPGIVMGIILQIIYKLLDVSIYTAIIQIVCGGVIYIVLSVMLMYLKKDEVILNLIKTINLRLRSKRVAN